MAAEANANSAVVLIRTRALLPCFSLAVIFFLCFFLLFLAFSASLFPEQAVALLSVGEGRWGALHPRRWTLPLPVHQPSSPCWRLALGPDGERRLLLGRGVAPDDALPQSRDLRHGCLRPKPGKTLVVARSSVACAPTAVPSRIWILSSCVSIRSSIRLGLLSATDSDRPTVRGTAVFSCMTFFDVDYFLMPLAVSQGGLLFVLQGCRVRGI